MASRFTFSARLLSFGLVVAACPAALAQSPEPPEIPQDVRRQIVSNPESFIKMTAQRLSRISPDGVVTREAIDRFVRVDKAKQRATFAAMILGMDIDGDGIVSAAEIDESKRLKSSHENARLSVIWLDADTDNDGALGIEEILAFANNGLGETNRRVTEIERYNPLMFDQDGDGRVDAAEAALRIKAIAAERTPPGLQTVSRMAVSPTKSLPECRLPKPSDNAEIVLLSGYEGQALSTVAVSGLDNETTVATVTIEKGEKPLYILATSTTWVIWKLDGAVGRVSHFIVQPRTATDGPGAGVVGLDPKVVTFVDANACFKAFSSPAKGDAMIAKALLTSKLGRNVDRMIAHYYLNDVTVPSGEATKAKPTTEDRLSHPDAVDWRTWSDFLMYYAAGLADIDAKDVVASAPVVEYDVLPSQGGLVQLEKSGALRRTEDDYYVIEKPIARFPAGLAGAHSVRFLIAKGVPVPGGDPGHSTVISAETGQCVYGIRCR